MNILLTSTGRRTYMVKYFQEALMGKGLVHAANNVLTYSLTQADRYVITPDIYDEAYIDFLIDYCVREKIDALVPLFDIDLPILSRNKNRFLQNNVQVIVSDEDVIAICNDKWKTYNALLSYGIKQVKSFISLDVVVDKLSKNELFFPLVLKPRWGMGSIGVVEVNNLEELQVLYKKLQKDIFNTYLKYESIEDFRHCILIQEKIYGDEYGLDVFNDINGEHITTIAKRKIAMRSGETDIAQIVDSHPFAQIGHVLSKKLKHIANLDVDCFVTDNGDIYVLELNCRFGGQYPFAHNAGVNFPQIIIQLVNKEPISRKLITPTIGVTSCKDIVPVIFHND